MIAADGTDCTDLRRLGQGRNPNEGSVFTGCVQTAPLLFSRDGHALYLGDIYRGATVFLVAGGPSLLTLDLEMLSVPGILSLGLNNAPKTKRTNLWMCVDDPSHFLRSIWLDPTIMKFVPMAHTEKRIFDSDRWEYMNMVVGDCPNTHFFRRNERFRADQFLTEDTVNWGNHSKWGGGRSVLLAALRILHFLGVRRVYLLGVDFKMNPVVKYHFEQERSESSIKGNNKTFELLKQRFVQLKPHFEAAKFEIYNCNPDSTLKVFPFVDYKEAIDDARRYMPGDLAAERTSGLYDTKKPVSPERVPDDKAEHVMSVSRSTVSHDGTAELLGFCEKRWNSNLEAVDEKGVIVFCDVAMEWLLPWWFANFRRYSSLPLAVVDLGMSEEGRKWGEAQGILRKLPLGRCNFEKAWFLKPFALMLSPFRQTLAIDLDCEVRGPLEGLFDLIRPGIGLARDRHPVGAAKNLFRRDFYFNSGVILISRGEDVVSKWASMTVERGNDFRSDQEILNMIIKDDEDIVFELPQRYNRLRLDGDHADAVVMHWTGPKGKRHIRTQMPG